MKVLFTDRVWADAQIETAILEAAGHTLIDANLDGPTEADVQALVEAETPDAILVCFAPIPKTVFDVTNLKIISRTGIGVDNVPLDAAHARGVLVTHAPTYCIEEVSDHTVAMALSFLRQIPYSNGLTHQGKWLPTARSYQRLSRLTVGIIGCGRIGTATARKFSGLGIRVVGYDAFATRNEAAELVPLDDLIAQADVICLHAPLTDDTYRMCDEAFFKKAKNTAIVVNTARGPLIDNTALVKALENGEIAGAALDTIDGEPKIPAAFLGRDDVLLTPHVAFESEQAVEELRQTATEEVVRAFNGEAPLNPV